jgi:hypothetical protein
MLVPGDATMESEIQESRFAELNRQQQSSRSLKPHQLLEKYILGWECSVCQLYFELSESERHSMDVYGCEVPRRIRRMFEGHKCVTQAVCVVRQRQSTAVELEGE